MDSSSEDRERQRLIREAAERLEAFGQQSGGDLPIREKVKALQVILELLGSVGKSLIPGMASRSARDRILAYLRANVGVPIDGAELQVVGGISEYARRIRELRVQFGWPIVSGVTVRELRDSEPVDDDPAASLPEIGVDQYILTDDQQDTAAAARWNTANEIRRRPGGAKQKILAYLRQYAGEHITADELRYVAGNRTEWARRVRELRTQDAWPVFTNFSGDPNLPNGVYVLAADRQGQPHDRHISDLTRRAVAKRDAGSCRWVGCGWPIGFPDSDHRFLEVHHIQQHVDGGDASVENLVTLCNLHHDEVHRTGTLNITRVEGN